MLDDAAVLESIAETNVEKVGHAHECLSRRGEGMHHLAFAVDDIEAELERLRAAGATLIDERPRAGIYGAMAFVHHESLSGVLSELIQSTQMTEA